MSKLVNTKHELLARNLCKGVDKREAYGLVYQCAEGGEKRIYALLKEHPEIMDRQTELMDAQGISKLYLNEHLKDIIDKPTKQIACNGEIVEVEDKKLALDGIQVAYKLHGVLDKQAPLIDNSQTTVTQNNITINTEKMDNIIDKFQNINKSMSFTENIQDGEIINEA